MTEERTQRRLAAILAADVVGYSRLMGENEEGTLRALTAHTAEHVEPSVARHGGRIVKTTGDGLLAEFASVVDAVSCALDFQAGMRERNAGETGGAGGDRAIEFRIGVNLGDIIIQDGDVFGDGVNIAARLEGLCDPGGIFVSGTVYDHVDGKLSVSFEDLGEKSLKNIVRPVRVYRALGDTAQAAPAAEFRAAPAAEFQAAALPDKPSVAVLAFENMSGDPEQTYFAEGIAEDIITDLSKISGLFVIARNSSFAYQGKSVDLREVCRELNVRYILEGSVRRAGARVRINAQLIEGATGGHIWAERYDREIADIFAVQDEVSGEIVGALRVALTPDEKSSRAQRRKVDPEAYDLLVQGRERLYRFNAPAMAEARESFARAIDIDPDMPDAYAALSLSYSTEFVNGWNGPHDRHLAKAIDLAGQAIRIEPGNSQAYHALSLANLWARNFDAAESAARAAVSHNSNFAGGYSVLGTVCDLTGRHEEAIENAEKAISLDPRYDVAIHLLGRAQFALGRDEEAAASFERRLSLQPGSDNSRLFLAAIHGLAGRRDEAEQRWREILEINPDFSVARLREILPYNSGAVFERLEDGLRRAGITA